MGPLFFAVAGKPDGAGAPVVVISRIGRQPFFAVSFDNLKSNGIYIDDTLFDYQGPIYFAVLLNASAVQWVSR